ncbi:hypothetical protein CWB99_02350 [Pseudoalteromonas rubra]|uniref:Uncharacterized protein n=1 Tax=Pseudoalteromonas rubra TaxID=43658 RepID=A0A5S3WST9_9GAMM|nr:hypothetical protein [Pseudoalteromonas rubra]TMP29248.1 hypothetical protein CWC00_19220 [Pseudoalteromonas rubra]TMP32066.1 hypothetical protein CWB99_02350 [Pseudoalteromonas rubra]
MNAKALNGMDERMLLLEKHFDTIEEILLAKSKIAANSGHPLHKGIAVGQVLRCAPNLPQSVAIGIRYEN